MKRGKLKKILSLLVVVAFVISSVVQAAPYSIPDTSHLRPAAVANTHISHNIRDGIKPFPANSPLNNNSPAFAFENMPQGKFTLKQYSQKTGVPLSIARRHFNILEQLRLVAIDRESGGKPNIIECTVFKELRKILPNFFNTDQAKWEELFRRLITQTLIDYRSKKDISIVKEELNQLFYQINMLSRGLHDEKKEKRVIGEIKLYLDSLDNSEEEKEVRIISYGSGGGIILHAIKEELKKVKRYAKYKIITIAADYDKLARRLSSEVNQMVREEYRIDEIRDANLLRLDEKSNEYDVILLEDVLHEVFSFAKPRGEQFDEVKDIAENRREVKRALKDLNKQLKPGGILIIEDRIKPSGDENHVVRVKLLGPAFSEDLYRKFFDGFTYKSKSGKTEYVSAFSAVSVEKGIVKSGRDSMIVELRLIDYLHFLSHMRSLLANKNKDGKDYGRRKIEKREVRQFFTREEYIEALEKEAGFRIISPFSLIRKKPVTQYVVVLNPEEFQDIIDEEQAGFKISTNIVAKKEENSLNDSSSFDTKSSSAGAFTFTAGEKCDGFNKIDMLIRQAA